MTGPLASPDLARWASVQEIQQLAIRYAYAIDTRDRELLESLWIEPDGRVAPPLMNLHTVHDHWRRWFAKGPSIHLVANHLVELRPDGTAHGHVYCLAQLDLRNRFVDRSLLYRDEYVRRDGRWLFASRDHRAWFGQARDQNPIDQPRLGPDPHVGRGPLPEALMPRERAEAFVLDADLALYPEEDPHAGHR